LTGAIEADASASSTTCSGSAEEIDHHGVEAARLGDQLHGNPSRGGSRAVDGDAGIGAR
jgi:hypothetical protein